MNDSGAQDYETWLEGWLKGRTFGFAFCDDYEVEKELRDLRCDRINEVIADWAAERDLLPLYRISEVGCPGDPGIETDRMLSTMQEIRQMGTYLLDAFFIHGLGEVVIFQSHEDILALGRRKDALTARSPSPPAPSRR